MTLDSEEIFFFLHQAMVLSFALRESGLLISYIIMQVQKSKQSATCCLSISTPDHASYLYTSIPGMLSPPYG